MLLYERCREIDWKRRRKDREKVAVKFQIRRFTANSQLSSLYCQKLIWHTQSIMHIQKYRDSRNHQLGDCHLCFHGLLTRNWKALSVFDTFATGSLLSELSAQASELFFVVVNFPSHFSLIPPSSISCESSSENSRCDDVIYWFSQDQTRPKVVSSTQIDDEICSSFLRSSHMVKCRAFISDNFRFLQAFCSSSSLLRNLDLNFKEGKFCNLQKYGSV